MGLSLGGGGRGGGRLGPCHTHMPSTSRTSCSLCLQHDRPQGRLQAWRAEQEPCRDHPLLPQPLCLSRTWYSPMTRRVTQAGLVSPGSLAGRVGRPDVSVTCRPEGHADVLIHSTPGLASTRVKPVPWPPMTHRCLRAPCTVAGQEKVGSGVRWRPWPARPPGAGRGDPIGSSRKALDRLLARGGVEPWVGTPVGWGPLWATPALPSPARWVPESSGLSSAPGLPESPLAAFLRRD